jgi:hypothetical protein
MKIKFLLLPTLVFFSIFSFVYSQDASFFDAPQTQLTDSDFFDSNSNLPSGVIEQISETIVPKIPAPGEQVTITVESFSSNLDKALISWKADGKTIKEGLGQKTVSFFAPESGKTLNISLTIKKEGGGLIQKTFTFSPADVDIIYEAETYTPPFYKGKALFTSEATIKYIAMPNFVSSNGQKIDPNNLVYTWKINDSIVQNASGYGKRTFETKGGIIQRPSKVGVEVSAINSTLKAKDSVMIETQQPEVVLYENNPLLGVIYEKGVFGSFLLNRPEVELQSIPYFFSTKSKEVSDLQYTWKINGNVAEISSQSSYSRFRNETGKAGHSIISLDVQHFTNILQLAATKLDLNFTEHENTLEADFQL